MHLWGLWVVLATCELGLICSAASAHGDGQRVDLYVTAFGTDMTSLTERPRNHLLSRDVSGDARPMRNPHGVLRQRASSKSRLFLGLDDPTMRWSEKVWNWPLLQFDLLYRHSSY